jgi:hypothetical protein
MVSASDGLIKKKHLEELVAPARKIIEGFSHKLLHPLPLKK